MWNEFASKIGKTENVREYEQILKEMDRYLREEGRQDRTSVK